MITRHLLLSLLGTTLQMAPALAQNVRTVTLSPEQMSCEAVNTAIQNLPSTGGTIVIPAGDFSCTYPIMINRDDVSVIGAGSDKTFLHALTENPVPVVIIGSTNNTRLWGRYNLPYPDRQTLRVTVKGINIDGGFRGDGKGKPDLECWHPAKKLSMNCGSDGGAMIRNNGLTIRGSEDIVIDDVNSHNNYSGGIVTEKIVKNLTLSNIDLHHNFFDGYAGYETTASTIKNFKIHENLYAGLSLDADFRNNLFTNGEIFSNNDVGIFSTTVGDNRLDNLNIHDNKSHGIVIENFLTNDGTATVGNCDGYQITNSALTNNGSDQRAAIHFGYACRNVVIQNVKIQHVNGYCVSGLDRKGVDKLGIGLTIRESSCSDGKSINSMDAVYTPSAQ